MSLKVNLKENELKKTHFCHNINVLLDYSKELKTKKEVSIVKKAKKIMLMTLIIAMLVIITAVPVLARNGYGNGQRQGLRDGTCVFVVNGVEVVCPYNGAGVGTGIGNGGTPNGGGIGGIGGRGGGARLRDGSGGNPNCPFLP